MPEEDPSKEDSAQEDSAQEDSTDIEGDFRETDSDSDGFDASAINSPAQRKAATALRALSSYVSFEVDEKFRARAVVALEALSKAPSDVKMMGAVVDIHAEIKGDPGNALAFANDRVRHAAAIALFAISPHLRLTRTKVNHADLMAKFLANLSGAKHDLVLADVRQISLFAYWSRVTMAYCAVAEKLLSISDREYDPSKVKFAY